MLKKLQIQIHTFFISLWLNARFPLRQVDIYVLEHQIGNIRLNIVGRNATPSYGISEMRMEGAIWLDCLILQPQGMLLSQSLLLDVFKIKQYFLNLLITTFFEHLSEFVFKFHYLRNAKFKQHNISGTQLHGTTFEKCNIHIAQYLRNAIFKTRNISEMQYSYSSIFQKCNIHIAQYFRNAIFIQCNSSEMQHSDGKPISEETHSQSKVSKILHCRKYLKIYLYIHGTKSLRLHFHISEITLSQSNVLFDLIGVNQHN